jgi:hypothetical protein
MFLLSCPDGVNTLESRFGFSGDLPADTEGLFLNRSCSFSRFFSMVIRQAEEGSPKEHLPLPMFEGRQKDIPNWMI